MTVFIAGLGLIGGSYAKAIKKYTSHKVIVYDADKAVIKKALSCGAADLESTNENICKADISVICLYPDDTVKFIEKHGSMFKKNSIVTDSCGVKTSIFKPLSDIAKKNSFYFISSHPMAGKETSGFDNAESGLFQNASFIVIPEKNPADQVSELCSLAKECGFSQIKQTTAAEHDRMIAYTSQLPHVLACAYVLNPNSINHKGFSAGSFRDVSRVAKINSALWSELFTENSELLSQEIDILVKNLLELKKTITENDKKALVQLLEKGKRIKEQLD